MNTVLLHNFFRLLYKSYPLFLILFSCLLHSKLFILPSFPFSPFVSLISFPSFLFIWNFTDVNVSWRKKKGGVEKENEKNGDQMKEWGKEKRKGRRNKMGKRCKKTKNSRELMKRRDQGGWRQRRGVVEKCVITWEALWALRPNPIYTYSTLKHKSYRVITSTLYVHFTDSQTVWQTDLCFVKQTLQPRTFRHYQREKRTQHSGWKRKLDLSKTDFASINSTHREFFLLHNVNTKLKELLHQQIWHA